VYEVRLTVDSQAQTQLLKVVMDPRSPPTPEILQQQWELGEQIFVETQEARRALAEIASVQKQLTSAEQKVGEHNAALKSTLADAQAEVSKILTNKGTEPGGLQGGYSEMASALRVVEGGDRAAPSQAIAVYKEARQRVKGAMAEWAEFKQMNVPQLNQKLREGSLDPIAISEIEKEVQFLMSR
jgi:hypothetical protein